MAEEDGDDREDDELLCVDTVPSVQRCRCKNTLSYSHGRLSGLSFVNKSQTSFELAALL